MVFWKTLFLSEPAQLINELVSFLLVLFWLIVIVVFIKVFDRDSMAFLTYDFLLKSGIVTFATGWLESSRVVQILLE